MVLLGFLLASAQAFYIPVQCPGALSSSSKPSFFGQSVARRAPAPRATLIASLEDIERKLLEDEKAKMAAKRGKSPAPAPVAPKAPAPAPKAAAPAPKAAPAAPKPKPAVGERAY